MKAAPKVGLDGFFIEDELVSEEFDGVTPLYGPGNTPGAEPKVVAYLVGVPVKPGLFHPRFDLAAWHTYQEALDAAKAEYNKAVGEWIKIPEDERPDPPVLNAPDRPDFWVEGLTPEQIEELTKIPPKEPTPEQKRIKELEEQLHTTQEVLDFILISQTE
ncbi:hypothetical protein D1872_90010 [compost metagenome]